MPSQKFLYLNCNLKKTKFIKLFIKDSLKEVMIGKQDILCIFILCINTYETHGGHVRTRTQRIHNGEKRQKGRELIRN